MFSIYDEVNLTWLLRENNFAGVWPSAESLYCMGMIEIYPAITAMRAKAGREFYSPRQFMNNRVKEGATEFLGDILY